MRILFFVLVLCVVALLWAAISIARHIQRHSTTRKGSGVPVKDALDQEPQESLGIAPIARDIPGK